MELEPLDAEILDQAARLAHAHLAARRVDAGERNRDVAMFRRRLGDFLVGNATDAHAALVIHREHHKSDLALTIVGRHLRDGGVLHLVAEIAAARLQRLRLGFVWEHACGCLRVGMDVDRHQCIHIDFLGHGVLPRIQ